MECSGGTPFSAPPTRTAPRGAYICPTPVFSPPAPPPVPLRTPRRRANIQKPDSFTAPLSRPVSTLFLDPIHITTRNYESAARAGHPSSLLAGLLNGYNLALFTTRAARSPVWQVRRGAVSFWEANRSFVNPRARISSIIFPLASIGTTARFRARFGPRVYNVHLYFYAFRNVNVRRKLPFDGFANDYCSAPYTGFIIANIHVA